jgi:hypothetical protein
LIIIGEANKIREGGSNIVFTINLSEEKVTRQSGKHKTNGMPIGGCHILHGMQITVREVNTLGFPIPC